MTASFTAAVTLAGRNFGVVVSKPTPPKGAYVAHGGGFFPVTPKTGYPLSVVADIAAGQPGTLVLVPTADGVLSMLSGSGRVIHSKRDMVGVPGDSDAFFRTLLRLTLLSDRQEVISLGDIPELANIPSRKIALEDLALPPIIRRSRTWQMVAVFASLIVAGAAVSYSIGSGVADRGNSLATAKTSAERELSELLTAVKDGRGTLAKATKNTPAAGTAQAQPGAPLPVTAGSFMDQYYAAPAAPALNAIKVTNGLLQF